LQENSNWANIIYNALVALNNEAELNDIYAEVKRIIKEKYPEKAKNKEIEATIRGVLQRYSSDSSYFNGKNDLFVKVKKGRWGLR
jgi:isopropylmalate/homocitrate/citramalate synthase